MATRRTKRPWKPRVHLPESLRLGDILPRPHVAYGEWVVGAIVHQQHARHTGPDEMVPLSYEFAIAHVPEKVYRSIRTQLLAANILECDGDFHFDPRGLVPGKCLCYRLGSAWRRQPLISRFITHPELLRKMTAQRHIEWKAITNIVHKGLRAWHGRVEVVPGTPVGLHPLLDRMIDGERRFTVCEQGRVHTNVANLPRWCRQYIRLEGQRLMSIDVATSQPLLLGLVCQNRARSAIPALTMSQPPSQSAPAQPSPIYRPCRDVITNVYLLSCLEGTVYDRIKGQIPGTPYSREDVKALFLAVIYGEPRDMHTRVGQAIATLWPDVFEAVVDLNRLLGHGGLPRLLQRVESDIMITRVAGRILRERPGLPLLTVHDSVLVPPGHEDYAADVIADEWRSEFGVSPRLKVGEFTAPAEANET